MIQELTKTLQAVGPIKGAAHDIVLASESSFRQCAANVNRDRLAALGLYLLRL